MPIPLIIGAAIAAAGAVASAVAGSVDQANKMSEAQRLRKELADMYGGVVPPDIDKLIAEAAGPSAFEAMQEAPEDLARQKNVFALLEREMQEGGSPEAMAADMRAAREASNFMAGQQATLRQNQLARGLTGSGLGALMEQAAAQSGGQRMAEMELQQGADANRRRMQAISQAGDMAGQMRGQSATFMTNRGSAIDQMNRANAAMRWSAQTANAAAKQAAFDNKMKLLQAKANAQLGVASGLDAQGQQGADTGRDFARLFGGVGGTMLDYGLGGSGKKSQGSMPKSYDDTIDPWA